MDFQITGQIAQTARIELDRGEQLWASKGSIVSHNPAVEWNLKIPGGVSGALRRSLSGEGIALTQVHPLRPGAQVVLGANAPGHIAVWDLADGPVLTTRGAFLAAWGDDLDITVTVARRAGAAFFGGAGLFLQRVSGRGTVLVHGSGDFAEERLSADEEIAVSTGNLAVRAVTLIDGVVITVIDGGVSAQPRLRRGMMPSLGTFDTSTAREVPRTNAVRD